MQTQAGRAGIVFLRRFADGAGGEAVMKQADYSRVLVTGGNGFVGRPLCLCLLGQGRQVAAALRAVCDLPPAVEQRVIGAIDAETRWEQALAGVEVVVHTAARVHVMHEQASDPLTEFRRVNVQGTLNLAKQAAAAGVRRFVFISSVKVNGEATVPNAPFSERSAPSPQDAYGVSKWEAEQGLRQLAAITGMEVVIIRPPLIYGAGVKANFAALMRAVKRGMPLPLGAVHNQRSLVGLDNLIDFIVTCMSHPKAANEVFLVSDGHDLSTTELVRGMARANEVSARLIPVPVWLLQKVAALLGRGDAVQRLCGNLQVDIEKARSLLGWTPPVTVAEGLRRVVMGKQQ